MPLSACPSPRRPNALRLAPAALGALALFGATACGPASGGDDAGVTPPPQETTAIAAAEGGVAPSPDGQFSVALDSTDLLEDVSVTITERSETPAPEATLSPAYEVDVEGDVVINLTAELSFAISASRVEEIGLENLRVAHGETPGEAWDELLVGTWDVETETYRLTVGSFSYFMLVDESAVEEPACTCDTGEGCQADCGCDPACEAPSGTCSESCMAQSGAECCETCGCSSDVVCRPECSDGYQWDCEIGCCFSYETYVCEGEAS